MRPCTIRPSQAGRRAQPAACWALSGHVLGLRVWSERGALGGMRPKGGTGSAGTGAGGHHDPNSYSQVVAGVTRGEGTSTGRRPCQSLRGGTVLQRARPLQGSGSCRGSGR